MGREGGGKRKLQEVNEWSHQSVRHRYAFKSSAVLPVMTNGGATKVRIIKNRQNIPTIMPNLLSKSKSVILTGFADLT